ncbi:MAG: twin-arginine translocation signal domain-containing protein [Gemmatimonadetes bacterium]|nr:twin-arginine translocation signal domain-containing protein [Gemmatimonadota bacterium]
MTSSRRDFLARAALTATGAAASAALPPALDAQGAPAAQPARTPETVLDPMLLAAVGEAVLPESLGAAGRRRAVGAFATWLARYEPVAEAMHGYGDAEITYTPPDPAPGWQAQLRGVDTLARRSRRKGFAALGVAERRAVLEVALRGHGGTRLPANPLDATHVAVAVLAHWAASTEATDLAQGARILAGECRGLAGVSRVPLPLAGEGRP